jgi:probable F420-dependent oxidoreductase
MIVEGTRRRLGRFGVWVAPGTLRSASVAVIREQVARIEGLGYGSLWTGEPPAVSPGIGREVFTQSAVVLAATERLVVGVGIANIGMRVPLAMHSAAATLAEAYPGRFVLGLGGQSGDRPLGQLRDYLDAMDEQVARLQSDVAYSRILAALGPKAHELAGERADGAHSFMQPVEHTAFARATLGPDPLLIPQQALVLDADAVSARGQIRTLLGLGRRNVESPYTKSYRRLGFSDADLAGERSDKLIDATLAWGDEGAIAKRLNAHLDAGADHVLLHPLADDLISTVDQLERIAPHLTR